MDALTTKQKNKMYNEVANLVMKYGNDKAARCMIKAYFEKLQKVDTASELACMKIVLTSLDYLLKITFPTK